MDMVLWLELCRFWFVESHGENRGGGEERQRQRGIGVFLTRLQVSGSVTLKRNDHLPSLLTAYDWLVMPSS